MKQSMRECSRKGCKNTVSPEKSFKMCAACLAAGLRWRQKSKDKKLEARKQGVRLCARAWCYTKLPKDSLTSTCANCLRSGAERYRRAKQAKVATGCCLYCPQRAVGTRNFCLTHSLKDRRGQLRIRARKRNLEVDLTEEGMNTMFVAPCFYYEALLECARAHTAAVCERFASGSHC